MLVHDNEFYGLSGYSANAAGGIFKFDMNSNTPTLLDEFAPTTYFPYWHTGLVEYDGKLWGTADTGGTNDDGGIIAYVLPDNQPPTIQWFVRFGKFKGIVAVTGLKRAVSVRLKQIAEKLHIKFVIFNNQNCFCHFIVYPVLYSVRIRTFLLSFRRFRPVISWRETP